MQKAIIVLISIVILLLGIYMILNVKPSEGLYKVGNLTICDPYHDKTACSRG